MTDKALNAGRGEGVPLPLLTAFLLLLTFVSTSPVFGSVVELWVIDLRRLGVEATLRILLRGT